MPARPFDRPAMAFMPRSPRRPTALKLRSPSSSPFPIPRGRRGRQHRQSRRTCH